MQCRKRREGRLQAIAFRMVSRNVVRVDAAELPKSFGQQLQAYEKEAQKKSMNSLRNPLKILRDRV